MNFKRTYTEKELVEGCVRNERKFQELFYRRFFPKMMSMCMRHTRDEDKAMIILNDGFLRVFKKIDQFGFKGSLEGWVRKLVFHSLSDFFRKENKYTSMMIFEEKDASYHQKILSKMYLDDLLQMVYTLPKATQRVFELYAIEGYTHPEISKTLDISVGTSKWHLSEARKKLKVLLASYYQEQKTDRYASEN